MRRQGIVGPADVSLTTPVRSWLNRASPRHVQNVSRVPHAMPDEFILKAAMEVTADYADYTDYTDGEDFGITCRVAR